jgi:hypothetical protein
VTILPISKPTAFSFKSNVLAVTGTARLAGVLRLDMSQVTNSLQPGNYFTLFNFANATVSGRFSAISPAVPGEGLVWDVSQLYTTGKLYVREEGYDGLNSGKSEKVHIYPSVVTDKFTVGFPSTQQSLTCQLLDVSGHVLKEQVISGIADIDVSGFKPGKYLIKLTGSDGETTIQQIVKK